MDAYFLAQLFPNPLFIADFSKKAEQFYSARKLIVLVQALEKMPSLQQLLHDILQSCKLDPEQDAEVIYVEPGEEWSWRQIKQRWDPAAIILFGVSLTDMAQPALSPYQPVTLDAVQFLYADPLAMLHEDKSRKKLLWQALKRMFF
ncbi:MAG: hypothetical protein IRZ29_01035 [Thermoflavifilum sp.]|nr:hypothetical protein [Thermoflavifilum sp.]